MNYSSFESDLFGLKCYVVVVVVVVVQSNCIICVSGGASAQNSTTQCGDGQITGEAGCHSRRARGL